ncbi:MAG TPA: PhzF family phenazine biosynthesis protein [Nocardioidaceae bacterium]|nr:PhzF family phenazine biosynthesis protein [Nocardioidaceae bacterium]
MLRYDVVDVFTDRPFAGNQLAVVHGTDGLSDEQLLALAKEFHYSETTFPSRAHNGGYSVRIFTPGGEIPFAGHPTLGTAWVLRDQGVVTEGSVVQTCGAGEITVSFDDGLVSLRADPGDLVPCPRAIADEVLVDLGLGGAALSSAYFAGTGLTFLHLQVEESSVRAARPAFRPLESYPLEPLRLRDPLGGIDVYAVSGLEEHRVDVHVRMFSPGLSVPEDAATGSSAAGLGLALVAARVLPRGGYYRISQGAEIGRPSTLHGSVTATDGVATSVNVAGAVQPIASGQIAVPPA